MTEIQIFNSPPQLPSSSSSNTCITPTDNGGLSPETFLNNESLITSNPVALYRRNCSRPIGQVQGDQLSVLAALVTIFRRSFVGCKRLRGVEDRLMEIGWPTNVRHVAHVTFDRFNGFLGLPVEFEPEVPRRPPSASTRVFGVSTESMQLSFDSRGNCVPTILLMMQRRLYLQGGLQSEGIFRINPENGQEEYLREQLNNGFIPDNIDVHCLAGLIKAWFRELPRGVLDPLSPEQVMHAQSEDDCTYLVRHLPPTEAALLDWAINLMADVAQFEHLNKMNPRNIAMVFAPNMTQMSDPLTALMFAVQVMNFLKTLVVKTLREREDSMVETEPTMQLEPSDENGPNSILKPINPEACEATDEEELQSDESEPKTDDETYAFLSSIEKILLDEKGNAADNCIADILNASVGSERTESRTWRAKSGQSSNTNNDKKESKKHIQTVIHDNESAEKNKEKSIISLLNSETGRAEAWR
ncbi:hypothetical protein CDL12_24318 [Handroanthus impetiginosus]|uniref:Uncharacterized protein n=1 Tax=Handroanthus impetiginosus TaxID=429701 RepID=A0A2G9GCZ6_9LAMI|nr:hypothetical protein CDL12_24318 [Handroanthus impetiginosus]